MTEHLLTFVHISDTHIPTDPAYRTEYATIPPYEGALKLVEQLNNLPFKPDFVLHTGDVAYDPDPEAYANCKDILSGIPYPTYYVAGNHDSSAALQTFMMGNEMPMPQLHYTFDVNGVQFVVVDSNGPAEPPRGYMTDSQLAWLERICCIADDPRPLVIATHHNPVPVGIPWLDHFMGVQNGEAFHRTIYPARERIRGVFFGHIHQNMDIYRDGIFYCSTLSPWLNLHAWPAQADTVPDENAEGGFNVVTISSKQTTVRRHRFRLIG